MAVVAADRRRHRASLDIGLAPGVPLSLIVLASSGSNTVDLTGLQLERLEVDASSGDSQVVLPAADQLSAIQPAVELQSSSGRMEVQAPESLRLRDERGHELGRHAADHRCGLYGGYQVPGSSGQFALTVGNGQALRWKCGRCPLDAWTCRMGSLGWSGTGQEGVWQTAGYDSAANRVNLVIESMSSGTVKVQVGA